MTNQDAHIDTARYLERIGFAGTPGCDLSTLERLQRAHLTAVPFENFHVFHRRGVRTDEAWSVSKVVEQRRGGWCFELNGAFGALLRAVGFRVKRLGATVLLGDSPAWAPNHMALEVTLDRPYLVDVGFGDSFIRPLRLDHPGPHDGGVGSFAIREDEGTTTLILIQEDGTEVPQYRFERRGRRTEDFDPASHALQTTPGLRWTQTPFATRLLDGGPDRVTLLADRLKIRRAGKWTETPVSAEQWDDVLGRWFSMTQ